MTEHIVAVFETEAAAATAESELSKAGISASVIRRYAPSDMPAVEASSGSTHTESTGGGFWAWLMGEDTGSETTRSAYSTDWDRYDRRAQAGNTVVSLMLRDEAQIQLATDILEAHHPLDIDEHTHDSTTGLNTTSTSAAAMPIPQTGIGTSSAPVAMPLLDEGAAQSTPPAVSAPRTQPVSATGSDVATSTAAGSQAEEVISRAEEQIEVGKRTVDRGTTRVRRYVVETPVERDVTLHGERVTIERRRPVEGAAAAAGAFEERIVEVHESEEVPVVEKTARVVEEVTIRREETERTETVRDTVRREEVEVDKGGQPTKP